MMGWKTAVRIEKILCTVLHGAHKRQLEEAMETLCEGPGSANVGASLRPGSGNTSRHERDTGLQGEP
jgi:hypothetical protein